MQWQTYHPRIALIQRVVTWKETLSFPILRESVALESRRGVSSSLIACISVCRANRAIGAILARAMRRSTLEARLPLGMFVAYSPVWRILTCESGLERQETISDGQTAAVYKAYRA